MMSDKTQKAYALYYWGWERAWRRHYQGKTALEEMPHCWSEEELEYYCKGMDAAKKAIEEGREP